MIGLVMIFIACGGLAFLSDHAAAQWPIAPARFAAFAGICVLTVNLFAAGLLVVAAGCGKTHAASPPPRRRAALLLRLTLANLLVPAFLYGVMTSDPVVEAELAERGWDTAFGAVIAVLVVLAWRLWRRSRQYGALGADEAMARDPRPPVLYLRSFADDGETLMGEQSWWMRRGAAIAAPVTPEQEMADLLDAVGPVVAIGKPGEPLPELGAARLYVSDDQWQAKVQELMKQARLVVVRLGASPGLLWEIEQALAHLPRQRLVLALLGGSVVAPALVQRLAPALGPTFAEALPQARPHSWTQRLYRDTRAGASAASSTSLSTAAPMRCQSSAGRSSGSTSSRWACVPRPGRCGAPGIRCSRNSASASAKAAARAPSPSALPWSSAGPARTGSTSAGRGAASSIC